MRTPWALLAVAFSACSDESATDVERSASADASPTPSGADAAPSKSPWPDAGPRDGGPSDAIAAGDATLAVDASTEERRLRASLLDFTTVSEAPGVAPWFTVVRPADLEAAAAETRGKLPLVVWANGGCLRVDFVWAALHERWARAGFVVLALSEGGADSGFLASTTVADHVALIDWALRDAPFAASIDENKIVAAGNSCGGVTALGAAAQDARIAAAFVLSGSSALASTDRDVVAAIRQPVGFVTGSSNEDIAAPNAAADYALLEVPAMLVTRTTGDHLAVSSDAQILLEVAEIATEWMDLALYGTPEAGDALLSPAVCTTCTVDTWTTTSKRLDELKR